MTAIYCITWHRAPIVVARESAKHGGLNPVTLLRVQEPWAWIKLVAAALPCFAREMVLAIREFFCEKAQSCRDLSPRPTIPARREGDQNGAYRSYTSKAIKAVGGKLKHISSLRYNLFSTLVLGGRCFLSIIFSDVPSFLVFAMVFSRLGVCPFLDPLSTATLANHRYFVQSSK